MRGVKRQPGLRYGLIELLENKGTKPGSHHTYWLCKCHGCKKEYVKLSASLKPNTYSCGCELRKQNSDSPNWKGVGEISSSYITRVRRRAQRDDIDFSISGEYMWAIFLSQNRLCCLSGLPIYFGRSGRDECTASLDRKDSSLPYVEGNVQWVHKHINAMKLNHKQEYFIHLCKTVIANQEGRQ